MDATGKLPQKKYAAPQSAATDLQKDAACRILAPQLQPRTTHEIFNNQTSERRSRCTLFRAQFESPLSLEAKTSEKRSMTMYTHILT